MSIKVLHLLDCYLPETMNWLEGMLASTVQECEHHIAANYHIEGRNIEFNTVQGYAIQTKYPISNLQKVRQRLTKRVNRETLKQYIAQKKIDIIHVHFGNILIEHKAWLDELELPICCSLYGYDYEYLIQNNTNALKVYTEMGKMENFCFIVEGKYSRNLLNSYGIDKKKINIVRMIFDRGIPYRLLPFQTPIRMLQVATYTEKKNQLGFIDALDKNMQGRLSIAMYGEIKDKSYYKEVVRAAALKKNIRIEINDKLSFPKYLETLQECHFAVNMSIRASDGDTEGGSPVFIKDALLAGKPVVSTTHCDIPEWIMDGYNGFIAKENNVKENTSCISRALALHFSSYQKMSHQSRETFQYHANTRQSAREWINIYQSMICAL